MIRAVAAVATLLVSEVVVASQAPAAAPVTAATPPGGLGGQLAQKLKGADFVVTGDVTEFGRKEVGDHQLFGILGRGKTQIAYAKVALNIVNISTSEVVYSTQGAGEYALSNREIIGFGGTASYDSTLNGKVLDLAMREAINKMVDAIDNGQWKPQAR